MTEGTHPLMSMAFLLWGLGFTSCGETSSSSPTSETKGGVGAVVETGAEAEGIATLILLNDGKRALFLIVSLLTNPRDNTKN